MPVNIILPSSSTPAGEIIDKAYCLTWLGENNVEITTSQADDGDTIDDDRLQIAIDTAEARIKSRLSGYVAFPLAVAGIVLRSTTGTVAYPLLRGIAVQFVGFYLNKWRSVQSVGNQAEAANAIDQVARLWEKNADAQLDQIVNWLLGDPRGASIDLDLSAGYTRPTNQPGTFESVPIVRSSRGCGDEFAGCC